MPLLRKSMDEYPYWDRIQCWPMPEGVAPELVWAAREVVSLGKRATLPLLDKKGKAFSYWLPARAQEWLHRIDRNASSHPLDADDKLSAQGRGRVITSSLMEEAIASSQIEGAAATRKQAKEMLRSGRDPVDRSERMILNNYRAIERIRTMKDEPLSIELMHELHRILTEETLDEPDAAGRLRRSPADDEVKVFDADGTVLHAPPAGQELSDRMAKLLSFANAEETGNFIHPVVKAILLHFWVGYDHPYVDGNGRVGRGLFYWYLLRKGYWLFEYLSVSRIVLRTSGQYKRAFLYSEMGDNDATYFLMYNLRVIDLALDEIRRHLAKKRREVGESVALLRRLPGLNHRQRELLADALKKPGRQYTIAGHRGAHQVAYQTARTDLLGLSGLGLLDKVKSGKTFVFLASRKLERLAARRD